MSEEKLTEFQQKNKDVFTSEAQEIWKKETANQEVIPANTAEEQGEDEEPAGIVPTLQNIVATVNLDCKLDLKTIALHARNAEYNPKRFAAVIMRIREPKTTALIFASGKMVVTGAKSEQDSTVSYTHLTLPTN